MTNSLRFGTALSALALATMVGGCASQGARAGRTTAGQADLGKIGLSLRAQAALASQDYASAIGFAEQAVEQTPGDAAIRTLLGNAYFGSGRFASAEAAYRDSLALAANQPQVVLKLALVQIAQGRHQEAVSFLDAARGRLNASDYGLALALAGQPSEAIQILETAARQNGADSQVRQNLALAHAFAGDWASARIVAAQDLSPELVDGRMQQWMALANPARPSDQVAAVVGVTPAASDPGQPVRLALHDNNVRTVQAAVPTPVQEAAATAAPPPTEAAPMALAAASEYVEVPARPFEVAEAAPPPPPPPAPAFEAPPVSVEPAVAKKAPKAPVMRAASSVTMKVPLRKAAFPKPSGNSAAVVQIGAYGSPQRVADAWHSAARKYGALRAYTPMSARFQSSKGTVYRLSVKGFASAREAQGLCSALRGAGGSCFVRTIAGDAPVRIASR